MGKPALYLNAFIFPKLLKGGLSIGGRGVCNVHVFGSENTEWMLPKKCLE